MNNDIKGHFTAVFKQFPYKRHLIRQHDVIIRLLLISISNTIRFRLIALHPFIAVVMTSYEQTPQ